MDKEIMLNIDGSHNGYEYVDLGLPSGIKWATCNVGADTPEDTGLLFQFGRTDGYKYGDINNNFSTTDENESATGSIYINTTTSGVEYGQGQKLNLEDDAAHVNMGGDWIMPTKDDFLELYNNATGKVVTINDKKGVLFTSKINGKSIFFVFSVYYDCFNEEFAANGIYGCLWSSNVDLNISAFRFYFDSSDYCYCLVANVPRAYGYPIRGIIN